MSHHKEDISISAKSILNFLASNPKYGHTTSTKGVIRAILLQTDGQILAQGKLWDIKTENIGAGIYKISLKEHKYND